MSIQFTLHRTLPAPPARVFAALAEPDGLRAWMPNLVRIEPVGGVASGVGARFRETRRMFGREASEEFQVTAHEPPSRLGLRVDGSQGSSGSGVYDFEYRLAPAGEGETRLELDASITGTSRVMRWLGWLLGGMYRKMIDKDLDALARHLAADRSPAAV